jgi:hypothetical protein
MEQLRQEPQRMIADSPSLAFFETIIDFTGHVFEINCSIDYARTYNSWGPTPSPSSNMRLEDIQSFCRACAFSLLAPYPVMAVEKVRKGVVAVRRHPTCDLGDLTTAVRKMRDGFHAGGNSHEAFGKSKQVVLLSDAQFESEEDGTKAAELQVTFDGIGKEPIWAVWDIRIGGQLVFGGEEWHEYWAEG